MYIATQMLSPTSCQDVVSQIIKPESLKTQIQMLLLSILHFIQGISLILEISPLNEHY